MEYHMQLLKVLGQDFLNDGMRGLVNPLPTPPKKDKTGRKNQNKHLTTLETGQRHVKHIERYLIQENLLAVSKSSEAYRVLDWSRTILPLPYVG